MCSEHMDKIGRALTQSFVMALKNTPRVVRKASMIGESGMTDIATVPLRRDITLREARDMGRDLARYVEAHGGAAAVAPMPMPSPLVAYGRHYRHRNVPVRVLCQWTVQGEVLRADVLYRPRRIL